VVFDAMRDHYEGTPMDMTTDVGAGGNGLPYRWRPMSWEVDGIEYTNERAIATQQTGFWLVAQTRNWLPNPIGGVLWFGVDDASTSALTPIYCSTTEVPECFAEGNGSMMEYSPTSAFWLFNRVSNFAYLRYNMIGTEVRGKVDAWENARLAELADIDIKAAELYKKSPKKAQEFVTRYSVEKAQKLFAEWSALDQYLLVKYIDGNVKRQNDDGSFKDNGNGRSIPEMPMFPGYDEKWKRAVANDAGEVLKVIK
jgi:dipeptidase